MRQKTPWLLLASLPLLSCANRHRALVCPTGAVLSAQSKAGCLELGRAGAMGITLSAEGRVVQVTPEGAAATAGLRPGDLVIAVNDMAARSPERIRELLFVPAGASVTVEAMRGSQRLYFNLVSRPYGELTSGKRTSTAL